MNEITKQILIRCKDTIGYSESTDKESFMTGVRVALGLSEELYKNQLQKFEGLSVGYKSAYENTLADIKTLVRIIEQYSDK